MNINLLMAIFEEHKQRTSHNVFEGSLHLRINCNVCLYLDACKRELDKEEEAYKTNQVFVD